MSSDNLFYNVYRKKSDEELKAVAESSGNSDDSKLCAISILRERNITVDDYLQLEQELIEKRDTRSGNEIAEDRYATGLDRFIALVIDGMILSILGWMLKFYNDTESPVIIGLIAVVKLASPYLYNILFHGYCGQTIGKMIMNVKIYDKTEKKQVTYRQALLRDIVPLTLLVITQIISFFTNPTEWGGLVYLSFVMSAILLTWSLLEIVTMLFDSRKRALHDHIAGTVVLKINS